MVVVAVMLPMVIAAAADCVTVVTILSSVLSDVEIFCSKPYPFCPNVLQSSIAARHRPYALWMNVLRARYVLVTIASHVLNSLIGKMLNWTRIWTAVAMI